MAIAAPLTPSAGAPSFPKIRTQFRNRFVRMAQCQGHVAAVAFPQQKSVDKGMSEKTVDQDSGRRAQDAEQNLNTEGVPYSIRIPFSVKLGAENTEPAQPAENGQHENQLYAVRDRRCGDRLCSELADHNVVQQRHKIGNKLLHHDRNQQQHNRPVKASRTYKPFQHQNSSAPYTLCHCRNHNTQKMNLKRIFHFP